MQQVDKHNRTQFFSLSLSLSLSLHTFCFLVSHSVQVQLDLLNKKQARDFEPSESSYLQLHKHPSERSTVRGAPGRSASLTSSHWRHFQWDVPVRPPPPITQTYNYPLPLPAWRRSSIMLPLVVWIFLQFLYHKYKMNINSRIILDFNRSFLPSVPYLCT